METTLLVSPAQGVTAGSALSLTLIARNTSPRTLLGVVVAVPVPYGTSYADGSLYHDAVRVRDGAFFGDGWELAELAPGARTAFMWKLRIEAGDEPIRIVPQIFAGVTPVSGAEPIEVQRASAPRDLATAYGEFEHAARAYFAELFGREAPASLQQALFACALACALDATSHDHALEVQAHVLHRLARAVRGHYVTGIDSNARLELQALREARVAAATIEGLRAFAALDVAARNFATDDRVRNPISFA
jgi:uncharacterized repeat protein (TIGR01451 family)